ncbi:hypothetical protein Bca52824_065405 [Brassica carinata]|uniref:Uncharacterized protein n=1 Tax=Brassica carinata TaxID=52824 RepID=A0A8X7QLS2_BRACI|nr:hypothetical protein Bca52824_065405 [Brassica carinata]
MSINGKESKLQRPANKTLEDKEEMERGKRCYRRGSRNLSHQRTTISDLPDLRTTLEVLPSHFKDKQLEKQKCRGDTHRPDRRWQGKPNRRPVSEIFVNKTRLTQTTLRFRQTDPDKKKIFFIDSSQLRVTFDGVWFLNSKSKERKSLFAFSSSPCSQTVHGYVHLQAPV